MRAVEWQPFNCGTCACRICAHDLKHALSLLTSPAPGAYLYVAAALSLLTTLTLPYVGEEAVYTITFARDAAQPRLFRDDAPGHQLRAAAVSQLVNDPRLPKRSAGTTCSWPPASSPLFATTATGFVLAWLALNLTRNRAFAAFSRRSISELAMLFSTAGGSLMPIRCSHLLVFPPAIACLWVGALRRQQGARLVRGGAGQRRRADQGADGVFLLRRSALPRSCLIADNRRVLFALNSIDGPWRSHRCARRLERLVHSRPAGVRHGPWTIVLKLKSVDIADYADQLWSFPLETVLRFMPAKPDRFLLRVAADGAIRSRG